VPELYLQIDVPPVLTGAPIPTTVNLRLTDLETQVGLTGSIDPLTIENRLTTHIANSSNPHAVTKTQVGLGNCDNTSDAAKPVSIAQAAAILSVPAQKVGGSLTAPLTSITHTAPAASDYALQTMASGGFGFATADEAHTLLSVVKNLQTRVNEIEAKLVASGIIA
jgi:hypothetical protein